MYNSDWNLHPKIKSGNFGKFALFDEISLKWIERWDFTWILILSRTFVRYYADKKPFFVDYVAPKTRKTHLYIDLNNDDG